ncbi:putative lipid II flippase FtsW [Phosphitispora sp. TUW77]|uniref:putative lipid II flippase FtsW n=1 Tax=Phosphitispora sp. TUW77 TaxID=3152361 RepID=UPI003AB71FBB
METYIHNEMQTIYRVRGAITVMTRNIDRNIDWYVLVSVLIMLGIGIIMVLSASSPTTVTGASRDGFLFFRKQLTWVGIGLFGMLVMSRYNYRKLHNLVIPAAILTIILLLAVFAFEPKKGAYSWISIGSFQFQPSELVKLCLILMLAKVISVKHNKMRDSFMEGLLPSLILIGVVWGLVVIEPDLGTAMVIGITSFIMLYAGGANWKHLTGVAILGFVVALAAVFIEEYRLDRFYAFLYPFEDPLGKSYQIVQSLYAIGSGGFWGVGLGQSMQKFGHIPEQHTDFIFSVLSEELGFIGAVFVIILFVMFASRGYRIASSCRDNFGSMLACGITTMIIVEAVINIAVVTSSMPVTGITLPFISYGGSSLIFKMIAVGVLLNISKYSQKQQRTIGE